MRTSLIEQTHKLKFLYNCILPQWSNQCQYQLEPYQLHQVFQAHREKQWVVQASSYLIIQIVFLLYFFFNHQNERRKLKSCENGPWGRRERSLRAAAAESRRTVAVRMLFRLSWRRFTSRSACSFNAFSWSIPIFSISPLDDDDDDAIVSLTGHSCVLEFANRSSSFVKKLGDEVCVWPVNWSVTDYLFRPI